MDILVTAVIPVFALIACGYGAGKLKWLGPQSTEALNRFVFMFALPALLIRSIAKAPVSDILNGNFLAAYIIGMVAVWILSGVLSRAVYRESLEDGAMRAVNATYGNTGYLGIPLAATVFGPAAIVPASMTVAVNAILIIPMAAILIEVSRNRGRGSGEILAGTLKTLAVNPMVLSVLTGLLIAVSGA